MGLWNIHNCAAHTTNENHTTGRLTFHKMSCNASCKQVCTVDIHTPQLAQAVDRVVNGLEVLREASARHEVVDLSVLLDNVVDTTLDTSLV